MTSLNFNSDTVHVLDNPLLDNDIYSLDANDLSSIISDANISNTNDHLYCDYHEYVCGE
ncbi:MAG: hypothetical protein ACPHQD_04810 [Vibrio toranzoniae]|jgi:hypothetical protein|uniref:hypothetical protein n=1 Tax=Vibrio toranzoniae TaxID=1194427 RepID=UPI003C59F7BB